MKNLHRTAYPQMDPTPNGGFLSWLNSANPQSENPEIFPHSQYPFPYPHVPPAQQYAHNFFEPSSYNSQCHMPANATSMPTRTSACSSVDPQVVGDGHGDGDEEDQENNEEDEDNRSRRLSWTEADDIRLVSAWLNNSVDPLEGNCKKGDVYWKSVTEEYNNNSPLNRRRQPKHCKDHWGKSNKKVILFNGIWCRLKDAHESGQSDDQIMENTHAMYKQETRQCFTLVYWWKLVRDQPKWTRSYYKGKKKKNDLIDLEIAGETHPVGTKTAKAKAAMPQSYLSHGDIQMYYDTQALRASTVEKTADVQLRLSREKLEAAQARERTSMVKMYTDLLMADLSGMSDLQRAEHQRALQYFGDKLYGANNTG